MHITLVTAHKMVLGMAVKYLIAYYGDFLPTYLSPAVFLGVGGTVRTVLRFLLLPPLQPVRPDLPCFKVLIMGRAILEGG